MILAPPTVHLVQYAYSRVGKIFPRMRLNVGQHPYFLLKVLKLRSPRYVVEATPSVDDIEREGRSSSRKLSGPIIEDRKIDILKRVSEL